MCIESFSLCSLYKCADGKYEECGLSWNKYVENARNIMMLYFADYIVDGADTVGRLQYMIIV